MTAAPDAPATPPEVALLALDRLRPHPDNPRGAVSAEGLQELGQLPEEPGDPVGKVLDEVKDLREVVPVLPHERRRNDTRPEHTISALLRRRSGGEEAGIAR